MESTLSLKKRDYEIEVADFLGYGRDPDRWTTVRSGVSDTTRQDHINSIVKAGLSSFYFPDLAGATYQWSFLKPLGSFSLSSGAQELDLDDDFDGFVEPYLTINDSSESFPRVPIGHHVRTLYAQSPSATGHPQHAEVVIDEDRTRQGSARYRLLVYPEADAAYTLECRYSVSPHALSGERPYIYGGPAHHQTVLEACLAVAEQRRDGEMGLHTSLFKDRLRASVAADRRMAPKCLGYNGDASSSRYRRRQPGDDWNTVTINGVTPS